jgi:DNA repair protein SbcD/Mre11
MKLLHTSDWHLGRETYGVSRVPDHEAVLAEILGLTREHRPDLIVHSGDLFDTPRPALDDMHRAVAVLHELAALAPVIVLCGNHDSPALFRLFTRLLDTDTSRGRSARPAADGRLRFIADARPGPAGVLHYPARTPGGGEHAIRLAALPFVRESRLVDAFEEPSTWLASYADRIARIQTGLGRALGAGYDPARDVTVFTAHLHVAGASWSGSERALHVSDTYATLPAAVPPVTYAAFGHLHKPQPLPGSRVTGAFAGSPLQLDFTEAGEAKRIVLVEALPGRPAVVHDVPLSAGRALRTYTGTLAGLAAVAPGWGDALSRLVLETASPIPDLTDRVRALLPDAVLVEVLEAAADRRLAPIDERADGAEPTVVELFRAFLSEQGAAGAPAPAVADRFGRLLTAAEAGERPGAADGDLLDALHRLTASAAGLGDAVVTG